jgi:predicted homoserine dehydrogenase-like protein
MNSPLNVGLIGYGFAGGTIHAPVIASVPGLALAKVVERRADRAKADWPLVEIVRGAKELNADPKAGIVVALTPGAFARGARFAGKPVVVGEASGIRDASPGAAGKVRKALPDRLRQRRTIA